MVNQDYGKFYNAQKNNKSEYLGGKIKAKKVHSIDDTEANNEMTINHGVEGRNDHLRSE